MEPLDRHGAVTLAIYATRNAREVTCIPPNDERIGYIIGSYRRSLQLPIKLRSFIEAVTIRITALNFDGVMQCRPWRLGEVDYPQGPNF